MKNNQVLRSGVLVALVLLMFGCQSAQDTKPRTHSLQEVWRITEPLNEPVLLRVYGDLLVAADMQAERPLPLWDTTGNFLGYLGRGWGEGPGEFSRFTLPVGRYADSLLLVLDMPRGRISALVWPSRQIYGAAYIGTAERAAISRHRLVYPASAAPFLLTLRPFEMVNHRWTLTDDTLYWGALDTLQALQPVQRSPFLKSMALYADAEGDVFVAFRWASVVAAFSPSGRLRFLTEAPWHVPFPEHREPLMAPSPVEYPEQYLDVAADSASVYALYQGKKLPIRSAKDVMRLLAGEIPFEAGQLVACFDRRTGAFVDTIRFPVPLRSLDVTENALYVLTTEPSLIKYQKPCTP